MSCSVSDILEMVVSLTLVHLGTLCTPLRQPLAWAFLSKVVYLSCNVSKCRAQCGSEASPGLITIAHCGGRNLLPSPTSALTTRRHLALLREGQRVLEALSLDAGLGNSRNDRVNALHALPEVGLARRREAVRALPQQATERCC